MYKEKKKQMTYRLLREDEDVVSRIRHKEKKLSFQAEQLCLSEELDFFSHSPWFFFL